MNIQQAQQQLLQRREYDERRSGMVSIGANMGDVLEQLQEKARTAPTASEDKAPHERAYWVELTRKALGKHWKTGKEYTFGQVNGLTRKWSMYEIRDRYYYCVKANCEFAKVWFGMRKQDKERKLQVAV